MPQKRYICPEALRKVPIRMGRLRLCYRWTRYFFWSLNKGHYSGIRDSLKSICCLVGLSVTDLFASARQVKCNVCGWEGVRFYPNTGPGYFELDVNCPRCHCIHRYRSLAAVLDTVTDYFSEDTMVIEVAPIRSFQAYSLQRKKGCNYVSFDLKRFGMERGDLTKLHFGDACCDFFLCFHVLEHVSDEAAAFREIFRVLRPGGRALLQVPIDYSLAETVEYGGPNPLETGHVRRYSRSGFADRLLSHGFTFKTVSVQDLFEDAYLVLHGFNPEPIYIAVKSK